VTTDASANASPTPIAISARAVTVPTLLARI
jgi:hypothetical protein